MNQAHGQHAAAPVILPANLVGLVDRENATLIATMPFSRPEAAVALSQLLARDRGVEMLTEAVQMAVQSARSHIECECTEAHEDGVRWWNTEGGLFTGSASDNDIEFLQMRERAIEFLEWMHAIVRHPEHPAWIRFIEQA